METNNILSERAVLTNISIHCWGGTKVDRKATKEINDNHGASYDAGTYVKNLLPKEIVEGPQQTARACRKQHERLTLPWGKAGYRVCSAEGFERWAEMVNEYRDQYDGAVAKLLSLYDNAVERRRIELNGLFNESDYPSADDLRRRYVFDREVVPVPVAGNFVANLFDEQAKEIRDDLEKRNQRDLKNATDDIFKRLHDKVSNLADALDGFEIKSVVKSRKRNGRTVQVKVDEPSRRLYDSMVDHLVDLVDILPALNITGDVQIAGFIKEVKDKLTKADVDTFKQNTPQAEAVRAQVKDDASDIADRLAGFFSPITEE